jgi:hypothetical protein
VFAIELLGQDPVSETARGRITLGEFTEGFEADLTYWGVEDYRRSWLAALSVLETGPGATSCLVSSITDPASSNFVFCWPLYRAGDDVFVQNALVFLDELTVPFDPARPWLSVQPRATVDEDGNRISEWRTEMAGIRRFRDLRSLSVD